MDQWSHGSMQKPGPWHDEAQRRSPLSMSHLTGPPDPLQIRHHHHRREDNSGAQFNLDQGLSAKAQRGVKGLSGVGALAQNLAHAMLPGIAQHSGHQGLSNTSARQFAIPFSPHAKKNENQEIICFKLVFVISYLKFPGFCEWLNICSKSE